MKTVFIYALCEPGTRTSRYIGKAKNPEKRLKWHWNGSRKRNNPLGRWLRSLFVPPSLLILKEVLESEWQEWECRYIRGARSLGFQLTNGTDGGEGISSPSEETRARMRAAKLGLKLSLEHRERIGKAVTLRLATEGVSKETRKKMSEAQTGENHPMFGVWGVENPNFGKKTYRNTSGFPGVTRKGDKWVSRFGHGGTRIYVGIFKDIEDAVFARALAVDNRFSVFVLDK